ncbi:MAG: carboxypeptidase regulatory-like domain-containing protein [bacterium]|nr:carboxypeptidase regulatory-like domain-containing protein [bacterium]
MSIISSCRRGSAEAVFVVIGVLLVGAVLCGMLFLGSTESVTLDPSTAPQAPPSQAQTDTVRVGDLELPQAALGGGDSAIELGGDEEWRDLDKVFDGQGTISGTVDAAPGVVFPDGWELVVEPSKFVIGRKKAVTRVLELPGNQRTFEVRDLPMAAYRVYARARGLNCAAQEVSLYKVKGYEQMPGNHHARVMLRLMPAGFLDGSVLDDDGLPVEGLPVTIERLTTRERRMTLTGPDGLFAFQDVLDGKYMLYYGSPNKPLVAQEELHFRAPQVRRPEVVVPRLASIKIEVIDEHARGIPQAKVRGFGPTPIDTLTDAYGIATLRFLPAGRYKVRVDGSSSGLDRHGKMDFHLQGDEELELVQIVCRE